MKNISRDLDNELWAELDFATDDSGLYALWNEILAATLTNMLGPIRVQLTLQSPRPEITAPAQ